MANGKNLVVYFAIGVGIFAAALIVFLCLFLTVPARATVNEQLTLVVGAVILVLVSCLGLVVLIDMATNRIDLSGLLSEPGGGASLSRFQFLVFTFVISLSLFLVVAHSYTFPPVPSGILALLGISASTYAVSKGITASDPENMAKKPQQLPLQPPAQQPPPQPPPQN